MAQPDRQTDLPADTLHHAERLSAGVRADLDDLIRRSPAQATGRARLDAVATAADALARLLTRSEPAPGPGPQPPHD